MADLRATAIAAFESAQTNKVTAWADSAYTECLSKVLSDGRGPVVARTGIVVEHLDESNNLVIVTDKASGLSFALKRTNESQDGHTWESRVTTKVDGGWTQGTKFDSLVNLGRILAEEE